MPFTNAIKPLSQVMDSFAVCGSEDIVNARRLKIVSDFASLSIQSHFGEESEAFSACPAATLVNNKLHALNSKIICFIT